MSNCLKIIGILLVVGFIGMIIASRGGYYEAQLGKKKALTEEAIKRFEEDVREGKNIEIDDYVTTEIIDYNNNVSKLGKKISRTIENAFTNGMKYLFKSIDKVLNE